MRSPFPRSHPSRGAWIEICLGYRLAYGIRSHPSRGAWIEIAYWRVYALLANGRTPHGVRGLKLDRRRQPNRNDRRTPHGVRGLK